MFSGHSSSTSSEDDMIDPRTLSRDPYIKKSMRRIDSRKRYYHPATDICQACQVMITYRKDSSSSNSDEILIKQRSNNDEERMIVYKGYLKSNDRFVFKSQHLVQYPFDIKFYVNGYLQAHLLTCCEFKYRRGGFRINRLFLIEQIEKSIPCRKCRRRRQEKENEEIPLKSSLSEERSRKNPEKKTNRNNEQQIEENNHLQSIKSIDQNNEQNPAEEENGKNDSSENEDETNESNPLRQMLMERTADGTDNEGSLLQSFLALLQNGLRRKEIRKPISARHQGNVENFVVLLLGISDDENLLHSIMNFVQTFENTESLKTFLDTLSVEKTILIITDSFAESIEDFSRFDSIYILSNDNKWKNHHSNIRGIYRNFEKIFQEIPNEFSIENDLILIESISSDEKENSSFAYSQLLKETILRKDNEGNLEKDFLDYCRLHYQQNSSQLKLIDQFEKDSTKDKSIWWFTRNCFISKMRHRALRTQEIDLLFKTRWIIQSIDQQIKANQFSKIVYRIVHLSSDQLEKVQEHLNGLISFGTFLDCSLNKPSEIEYLNEKQTILFEIETTNGIEIEQIRHPDSNIEVLLSFDNVYQIQSIEQTDDQLTIIHLIMIEKDNEQFQQITNEMRSETEGPVVLIQLGKLLISNDRYLQADYLSRLVFDDNSLKDNPTLLASLAAVHHLLGSHDNRQSNHRAARLQFEQSLKIFLSFMLEDNQILSATYNNIGSMYYQEDQHDQAILFHEKALQCQLKATSPDIEAIATYSGNIGAVYLDQKKYEQALFNFKRSLRILQQSTPGEESLPIALVYDRIASVYWRMEQPDQALPFYQKALQLELKYLPENDHKISVSLFNLSTAYAKLNRLDEAINCAEKSVQQLLKSVPPDHPEVKENTEQLEGLRRRKWLQQLYQ